MIAWKHLFTRTILKRGEEYYLNKAVEKIKVAGKTVTALVVGSGVYHVSLRLAANNNLTLRCDCLYARDGYKCKHMAAVCYEAENKGFFEGRNSTDNSSVVTTRSGKDSIVKPFVMEDNGEFYYFNFNNITEKLVFKQSTITEAHNLIDKKLVLLDEFRIFYNNDPSHPGQFVQAIGRASYGYCEYGLEIVFDDEKIRVLSSRIPRSVYAYDMRYEGTMKKHEPSRFLTAFLLLVFEHIRKFNPGDTTNEAADRFLLSFNNPVRSLVPAVKAAVTTTGVKLEPRLELLDDELRLSFKVGAGKMYVVRNLPDLVKAVEKGEVYSLGTKNALDFSQESIAKDSEVYYQLIKNVIDEDAYTREELSKNYYLHNFNSTRSNIPLHGNKLDSFFTLAKNSSVEFTDKTIVGNDKYLLTLQDRDPEVNLVVAPDFSTKGEFRGVTLTGKVPKLLAGSDYAYYVEDKCLNRVDMSKSKALLQLSYRSEDGKISFRFGRKKLNDFYRKVLPSLGDSVQILEEQPEIIEQYLAPEVKFSFYLDYVDPVITCKAMSHYGDEQYNLVELITNKDLPIKRDKDKELQIFELLRYFFNAFDANEATFVLDGEIEQILEFLGTGLNKLMELGEVNSTDAFKRLKLRRKMKLDVGVRIDSGIMDLEINSEDITPEELLDVLYSYKRKKKYYRLKSGEFLKLDEKNVEDLMQMLDSLHIPPKEFVKGKMHVPTYRALYLDKMLEKNSDLYAQRDSNFRSLIKEFKTISESDFVVPPSLNKILRNYQVQGYKWLRTLAHYGFGGILADDMGLGKTLQAIALLLAAKEEGELGTSLVVCPASLVYNWLEEFNRYAPEIKAQVIVGTQKERALKIAEVDKYDVLITSYDLLKRDIAEYDGMTFNYQFIDEAQFIKTHTTAAAKSVKTLRAVHKFALTGTPIENRLSELWSIFDYLMPGFLYEYEAFRRDLETPIVKSGDEAVANRLKQMVGPFILRRLKQEVLKELPDKIEEVRMVRMDEKQQKLYDGQVVRTLNFVESQSSENLAKSKIQVLAEITRLRQICCDPSLLFENYKERSAKRELCLETVKTAIEGEHKVLIFSQFTSVLELLKQDLDAEGIKYYVLTGQTSKEKRLELVRRFNSDDVPVFLISLKAGGTGLNLVGADVVIHYDPWWNIAAQNQATDRAHRIGQKNVVSVYKLIAKGSIEEKILRLQEDKSNLAEEILNGAGAHLITDMSKEELLNLL